MTSLFLPSPTSSNKSIRMTPSQVTFEIRGTLFPGIVNKHFSYLVYLNMELLLDENIFMACLIPEMSLGYSKRREKQTKKCIFFKKAVIFFNFTYDEDNWAMIFK